MSEQNAFRRQAFFLGFRKTLPFQSGVLPFGILYATLAASVGFPWWLIMFISIIVFGGSSQLVFIDLFQNLHSAIQAVLGANIVNGRHLIYSAGISQKFSKFQLRWKLLLSYLLTDQLFATSQSSQKELEKVAEEFIPWFYFGSGFCTWIFWQIACAFGGVFGHYIPASWNLGFSIPLMFMPLIFSVSQNKTAYLTCVLAVIFVVLFQKLPFGLGVFVSILLASGLGYVFKIKTGRKV